VEVLKFVRTGIDPLDSILMGGFPVGSSTLLYGPSESGKTFISVNAACKLALLGYRTLYIDADKKFDPKLIEQLYPSKCSKIVVMFSLITCVSIAVLSLETVKASL